MSQAQTSQAYPANGQMTIPQNGGHVNGMASAAAAADASAMPPPPPAPSLVRTPAPTGAQSVTPISAIKPTQYNGPVGTRPAATTITTTNYSVLRTQPHTTAATNATSIPTAVTSATKVSMGIPSPLPMTRAPTANLASAAVTTGATIRTAVARPPGVLAGSNHAAHHLTATKAAAPMLVRSPLAPATTTVRHVTHQQQVVRPTTVPQPVLSSAYSTAIARAPAHLSSAVGGQAQQQRVLPKYYAKAPAPPQRVLVGALAATASAAGLVPKPTLTSPVMHPVSSIPTPSPSASLQQQHLQQQHRSPAAVISGQITHHVPTQQQHHVSHMPTLVVQQQPVVVAQPAPMPPPAPVSTESIAATTVGSSSGSGGGSSSKKKSGHPLRRGKWTSEEEAYAARLINEFKAGLLPLTDGTTLRNFLSKLLNCDPMRISKKFVGNNCIGKQVFRRRVADINRLTPEQIQQMRVELSELERRFFDRVAATNRVKSPGVSAAFTGMTGGVMTNGLMTTSMLSANSTPINIINVGASAGTKIVTREELDQIESNNRPPTPPWLRPPANYKPKGKFAERLKAKKARQQMAIAAAQAAAAPPPPAPAAIATVAPPPATVTIQQHLQRKVSVVSATPPLVEVKAEAAAPIQRSGTSLDRLAQAAATGAIPRTESALEQLARTASAAKFVEDIVNGDSSFGDTQTPNDKKLSQSTLQGSFEALMSLDIHSVENLVELASSSQSSALLSELVNSETPSSNNAGGSVRKSNYQSSANLSTRMESFIKSLSSANLLKPGMDSSLALGSLLNASSSAIFDAETFSRRIESSTGFSQLRVEDGLGNGMHNSVEDFLSLVASGDIPHQDPNMLQVPLQKVMQQGGNAPGSGNKAASGIAKRKLSHLQQLEALASRLSSGSSVLNFSDLACGGSALKKQKKK